ncbi:venom factor-like [Bufo bufo]|uniref:venom factor-like n=1 Tax=Bufo bufo TaxID=8384 RepID=UPI001ABE3317|nr:venom factor-like [Bufo bufo]
MEWRVAGLLVLSCLLGSYAQPLCTLITPGILRSDTEETIVLDGHGSGFEADIRVQEFPLKTRLFAQGKISVNSKNSFLGTTTINVKSQDLLNEPKKKYYVSVQVISSQCNLEKVVLVSFHSGYIVIQTDKTIYTPGSKALYRIYPMNYKMQPKKQTVMYEIKNPDGMITAQGNWFPDKFGIISKNYELSDLAMLGTWTITAHYDNSQEKFSAKFDVKEYVLPNFEVTITAEKKFMHLDDKSFSVTITSQYIYKKPVNGQAFVIFGLKKDNQKRGITDSLRAIQIYDGIGEEVKLLRGDLIKSVKKVDDLLEYKLYVSVTVITDLGTDFVEAELDDIPIVKSPYKMIFSRTSKYFKPGMPLDLELMVNNPDGSPARSIMVVANQKDRGITNQDGVVRLRLNMAANINSLKISVRTDVPGLAYNMQASGETTVVAYKSLHGQGNYLHIEVPNNVLEPNTQIFINFNILNTNVAVQNQINHFTYLILSKGRIMKVGKYSRLAGQNPVSVPLFITEDLMPSFRIVAYYTVNREIVSDSLWVHMVEDCIGTLTLQTDRNIAKPQDLVKLTLKANYNSTVGLVAVDKGVFTVNSKYKLIQRKVWEIVDKSDLGCGPGSGADNMGVFYDAGLAVQTNFGMTTKERSDPSCVDTKRRKRSTSAALMEHKTQKASNYTDLEKKCCHDGMISNPMGHSCERRARLIQEVEKCVEAFLDCCRYIEMKLKAERILKETDIYDRSDEEIEYLPDADILVRSDFPESWYWNVLRMDEAPNAKNISTKLLTNFFLKDSITTWELLAVSLSENKGMCVAKPYEIQAFKNFFIDLRLPYSVVRNEQVEIRAIIYNYESKQLKVRVTFAHNPEFCSLSTARRQHTVEVTVDENSSTVVPFVIVPLSLGEHYVQVKASIYGELAGDGVKRKLKVVPEGVRKTEIVSSVILEPEARSGDHVVKVPSLANKKIVPGSPTTIIVNVQGIPIAQFLEDAIDGASISHLIVTPIGCCEQNMKRLTPVVIATYYLDATNQWDRIGVNRREDAIQKVNIGYVNQLNYRKSDGSLGSFPGTDSGTWLTAYILKVFAMAKSITSIRDDKLCESVKWLILTKQKPDGMFTEKIPISEQYSRGGLAGSTDADVAVTAFVVISLSESQKLCASSVNNLHVSINKAVNFIEEHYKKLKKPHSVAITSYALALAGRLKDPQKLLSVAKDKTFWDEGSKMVSIEATSYALLALLKMETHDAVDPVVRWLTEQHRYGEKVVSTQATIMLFQALAEYNVAKADIKKLNMDVSFHLPGRKDKTVQRIDLQNALQPRSEETNINEGFAVKATGSGKATLTVMAVYYELVRAEEQECKDFDLSVTVDKENLAGHDALETISLNICFRHRKPVDATMSIIDISMMTGFSPDEKDLNKLKNGVDKYISYFEINKGAFEKGALIIYLQQVSHSEEQCLKVKLNRYLNVGLVQPGSITIYDYYSPESRCQKFYHTQEDNKLFGRICRGNVCQCAEGNCLMKQETTDKNRALDRMTKACKSGSDYVFKAVVLEIHYEKDYDTYEMHIKEVFKRGTDEDAKGKQRTFISHIKCRENLGLETGKDYIIYGSFHNVFHTETSGYTYVLDSDSWLEWWPNDRECQNPKHQALCNDFAAVADELEVVGCQS